jgi:DNA-binding MarR family transcriptional regulator
MPKPNHPETMDFLLANICHLHRTRARQLFDAIGLYRGQPLVLLALWEQEGFTQSELAERLRIAPATVTKMLQRMEKTGFIQRKPDAQDQRVSRVYLTKAGRAIQGDVEAVWKTMQAET